MRLLYRAAALGAGLASLATSAQAAPVLGDLPTPAWLLTAPETSHPGLPDTDDSGPSAHGYGTGTHAKTWTDTAPPSGTVNDYGPAGHGNGTPASGGSGGPAGHGNGTPAGGGSGGPVASPSTPTSGGGGGSSTSTSTSVTGAPASGIANAHAAGAAAASSSTGELPVTGPSSPMMTTIGFAFIIGGAGVLYLTRLGDRDDDAGRTRRVPGPRNRRPSPSPDPDPDPDRDPAGTGRRPRPQPTRRTR